MVNLQINYWNCGVHLCVIAEQIILIGKAARIANLEMDLEREKFEYLLHDYRVIVSNLPEGSNEKELCAR
uniref:Uncharacterized protein n=1 Tax=Panagrolaimus sp. ES5 TaxID=591445 RepID=A0AC34F620_9BILA